MAGVTKLFRPGFDILFLNKYFRVTSTDLSDHFLLRCGKKCPDLSFITLDVADIKTNDSLDCIYANKVLHHLTALELRKSLLQQIKALSIESVIAHSFWIDVERLDFSCCQPLVVIALN